MRNLLMLFVVMGLAAVFVVFWDSPPEVFTGKRETLPDRLPAADSYMKTLETRKFNAEGLQTHVITATEGRYFKRPDRFELDKPHLISYGDARDTIPWHLRAEHARTAKRGSEVIMENDVYGWQTMITGKRELRTQKLIFSPATREVETDKKVIIETPRGKTSGVGMKANLKTQVYQLLSEVKGIQYGQ